MTATIVSIASNVDRGTSADRTYRVQVDTPTALRTLHVTIAAAAGGWWATCADPDLVYVHGAPMLPLTKDGCVAGAPSRGPLPGPYLEAIGHAITRHFHGA